MKEVKEFVLEYWIYLLLALILVVGGFAHGRVQGACAVGLLWTVSEIVKRFNKKSNGE